MIVTVKLRCDDIMFLSKCCFSFPFIETDDCITTCIFIIPVGIVIPAICFICNIWLSENTTHFVKYLFIIKDKEICLWCFP